MIRPAFRRSLRLETLESRELLTSGGPSAEAQYMLFQLNQARQNPAAEAQKVTSNLDANAQATISFYNVDLNQVRNDISNSAARPPLAWSDTLAGTATQQSLDQVSQGVQTHTGANGSNLSQRLTNAGITDTVAAGENAYAYSQSVDHAMQAFLIDWGVSDQGHRKNILQPDATPDQYYSEVGIGIVNTNGMNNPGKLGPKVITQDFAREANAPADLLGVAFNDLNHDGQYGMGEGQGNVEVDATNVATGQTQSTQTWDAGGGYQIPLTPGTYAVTAKFNGKVLDNRTVTIGNQNIEVDYNLTALQAANPGNLASAASAQSVSAAQQTAPTPAPQVQAAPQVVKNTVSTPATQPSTPGAFTNGWSGNWSSGWNKVWTSRKGA